MADTPTPLNLEAQAARAQEEFPGFKVGRDDFLRFLSERPEGHAHAADLYLAFACVQGVPQALEEFDRRLEALVGAAIIHLRPNRTFVEDVQQRLRQKLLVSQGATPPKLLEYQGRGSLAHWLQAVALREALNLLAQQKSSAMQEPEGVLAGLAAPGPDPEVSLLKRRYAPEFKAALEAALRELPARERNFLRLFFIEGLTVEQIARMDGTHKSTVSRRMAGARERVLTEMRRQLQERLELSLSELDSLVGQLRSQLELSLARALD